MELSRSLMLVSFSTPSAWRSCRTITPNLVQAYQGHFKIPFTIKSVPAPATLIQWYTLAHDIYKLRPKGIILVDHFPHPGPLIEYLGKFYGANPLPNLYIHVFGDFTLYTAEWLQIEKLLRTSKIYWICASERQVGLISKFMRSSSCVFKCPFPVDTEYYKFDSTSRKKVRSQFHIQDEETVFLYTGRLSFQKNILRLCSEFDRFLKFKKGQVRLILAGGFDDIGAPLFGRYGTHGLFFAEWNDRMSMLGPLARDKIEWIGFANQERLLKLYQAADVFVSFSHHHDEDFGMSPAEALSCGMTAMLADWGGYSSFGAAADGNSQMIPVKLTKEGLRMSSQEILRAFLFQAGLRRRIEERKKRGRVFRHQFSYEAAGRILETIYCGDIEVFQGFSSIMKKHGERFSKTGRRRTPFPRGPKMDTLYGEIYSAYTSI